MNSGWWSVIVHPSTLSSLTLQNYKTALGGSTDMGQAFVNSLAITLPATFIPILIASFAAYRVHDSRSSRAGSSCS